MTVRDDMPGRGKARARIKRGAGKGDEAPDAAPQVKLSGAQRAALFLLSLEEKAAAAVFRHMEPDEIRKIMAAMSSLRNIPVREAQKVFEEFTHYVRYEPVMLEGGPAYLRGALDKALGAEEARFLLGEAKPEIQDHGRTLSKIDPRTLANALEVEHPQTIALLMTSLEPRQAAGVLGNLPAHLQEEVMNRVARMERISPEVVADIESSILAELSDISTIEQRSFKGTKQAAAMLNSLGRDVGVALLEKLAAKDESLAEQVRYSMFSFEDLLSVADRGLQTILKEVSSDVLLVALKTASPELRDKFFRNMSTRAAEMMREDLEIMGPVRVSDVENAQREIAQVALRLQEEGSIVLAAAGEDMV
jgi:flagellar motor switch protein FliG